MKKVIRTLLLAAVIVGMVIFSSIAAKPKLIITTWGGLYEEAFREEVVKPFLAKHDCEIELVNPGGSTQILARLRAEKASPTIDLVQIGGALEAVCAAEGLVEKIDYNTLVNWKDLVPAAKLYPDFGPAGSLSATGILYHKDRMPFVPTSWLDFWDPRLAGAGKVSVFNIDGNYGLAMMAIINEMMGGTRTNLNPGFEKFTALMKSHKPLLDAGTDDPVTDLVQRGVSMALCTQSRSIGLIKEGFPAKFVYPKEGAFSWPTSIGVVKGSKNVELAKQFIDFFISPEINAKWCIHVNYSPVNAKSSLGNYEYAEILAPKNIYTLDWLWINSKRAEWIERWNIEVLTALKK